jgi:hypothetical protein
MIIVWYYFFQIIIEIFFLKENMNVYNKCKCWVFSYVFSIDNTSRQSYLLG